jgi:uncharacterized protein (TIGR03083 family)
VSRLGVAGLRAESASVVQIAQSFSAEEWNARSDCDGWAVRDVIAHMASIMHGVVDEAWMPDLSGNTEEAMEVPVGERRAWTTEEVLAEFEIFSGQLVDLGTVVQEPPIADTPLSMHDLGIHPTSMLPNSFLFDTYCHLRNDILEPNGPISRAEPPRDEMRLRPTVEWMLAGLPWMSAEQLGFVDRPLQVVLTGVGGGTWSIGPGGEEGRVLVRKESLDSALATVTSDTHDFVIWATRRRPWSQFTTIAGEASYARRVLDGIQVF